MGWVLSDVISKQTRGDFERENEWTWFIITYRVWTLMWYWNTVLHMLLSSVPLLFLCDLTYNSKFFNSSKLLNSSTDIKSEICVTGHWSCLLALFSFQQNERKKEFKRAGWREWEWRSRWNLWENDLRFIRQAEMLREAALFLTLNFVPSSRMMLKANWGIFGAS